MIGTGEYRNAEELVAATTICEVSAREPDAKSAVDYAKRYDVYCSLYPVLKTAFRVISNLDV